MLVKMVWHVLMTMSMEVKGALIVIVVFAKRMTPGEIKLAVM